MKKKIRVAIISFPLNVFGGGFDIFRNWLVALDKEIYEPHFITSSFRWEEMEGKLKGIPGIKVANITELNSLRYFYLPGIFKLIKYFRNNEIDIVHTSMIQADIIGGVAAKMAKVPVLVSTVIGYLINTDPGINGMVKTAIYRVVYGIVHKFFDLIMTISKATSDELTSNFGVIKTKLLVNYCGIELLKKLNRRKKAKESNNLTVGVLGEVKPAKGMSVFIESIPSVLKKHPTTRFIVAGDGPEKAILESKAKELGLESKVKFLGWVNNPREVIEKMDIFVFSSFPTYDGLPRVILEAWAVGTPTIATSVACVPELFNGKNKGLVINPGDSAGMAERVNELIADREKAELFAETAFNEIREFDKDMEVEKIQQIYQNLLGENSKLKS